MNSLVDVPTARARHLAIALGNWVYLIGGQTQADTATSNTLGVEQAEER